MRRDDKPLAAAAERLKGKPGRPRRAGAVSPQASGHAIDPANAPVTSTSEATQPMSPETSPAAKAKKALRIQPRLLDVDLAAEYLSLGPWTIRSMIASGTLKRVRPPASDGRDLRKVLVDRLDLDDLLERWKERA